MLRNVINSNRKGNFFVYIISFVYSHPFFFQLQIQEENHATQMENLKSELEAMKKNNEELTLKNAKLEKGKNHTQLLFISYQNR